MSKPRARIYEGGHVGLIQNGAETAAGLVTVDDEGTAAYKPNSVLAFTADELEALAAALRRAEAKRKAA
jgi:hypothetical protein